MNVVQDWSNIKKKKRKQNFASFEKKIDIKGSQRKS